RAQAAGGVRRLDRRATGLGAGPHRHAARRPERFPRRLQCRLQPHASLVLLSAHAAERASGLQAVRFRPRAAATDGAYRVRRPVESAGRTTAAQPGNTDDQLPAELTFLKKIATASCPGLAGTSTNEVGREYENSRLARLKRAKTITIRTD